MTATRVRGKQSDRKRQRSPRPRQCRADAEVKTKEVACSKRKRRWTVNDVHNSVLKVFVWHVQPNYKQPWCSEAQTSSTSSAWPIRLNGALRVVTNAHSVEHAALVQVKRHRHEQKYVAQVLCIGTDCDLALLEVPHADFWKGLEPLEILPGLPKLQDSVSVVGYPTGGESLSVTQGVVSRIDLVEYAQTGVTLLAVQIDAAINSGNSGGPVVDQKGNCVGVAFQNLDGDEESAENIGYIIPTEIVQHFLEDFLKNGHFTGFGSAGIHTQAVETAGPANGIILPDDVLLAVDGFKIGNDGEVAMPWGRVAFNYLLNRHYPGEHCEMQVLRREGSPKKITLQVCLERNRDLVCADAGGPDATAGSMLPRFLVTGGLVFVPLTMPFMEAAFGENFAEKRPAEMPAELLHLLENGHRRCADHEPLILTQVLASELTVGYSELEYEVLESFNGIQVRNLRHLAELLDGSKDTYLRFGFVSKEIVVLDRLKATQALASILAQNMIPAATVGGYFTPVFTYLNDPDNEMLLETLKMDWKDMTEEDRRKYGLLDLPSPIIVTTLPAPQGTTMEIPLVDNYGENPKVTLFQDAGFFKFCFVKVHQHQDKTLFEGQDRALDRNLADQFMNDGQFQVCDYKLKTMRGPDNPYAGNPLGLFLLEDPCDKDKVICVHIHFDRDDTSHYTRINLVHHKKPPLESTCLLHVEDHDYLSNTAIKRGRHKIEVSSHTNAQQLVEACRQFVHANEEGRWEDVGRWNMENDDISVRGRFRLTQERSASEDAYLKYIEQFNLPKVTDE